jgi:hypothetical protein
MENNLFHETHLPETLEKNMVKVSKNKVLNVRRNKDYNKVKKANYKLRIYFLNV